MDEDTKFVGEYRERITSAMSSSEVDLTDFNNMDYSGIAHLDEKETENAHTIISQKRKVCEHRDLLKEMVHNFCRDFENYPVRFISNAINISFCCCVTHFF